jgi:hypothetical protein
MATSVLSFPARRAFRAVARHCLGGLRARTLPEVSLGEVM